MFDLTVYEFIYCCHEHYINAKRFAWQLAWFIHHTWGTVKCMLSTCAFIWARTAKMSLCKLISLLQYRNQWSNKPVILVEYEQNQPPSVIRGMTEYQCNHLNRYMRCFFLYQDIKFCSCRRHVWKKEQRWYAYVLHVTARTDDQI
jgi:hypothetical protein